MNFITSVIRALGGVGIFLGGASMAKQFGSCVWGIVGPDIVERAERAQVRKGWALCVGLCFVFLCVCVWCLLPHATTGRRSHARL